VNGELGIVVASGMLKGVFSHGVLSAFEDEGLVAGVYGVASSSALSGGLAVIGKAREVGVGYWQTAAATAATKGMSQVVLSSLATYGPMLRDGIFAPTAPRFLLATSRVTNAEAAELTQGPDAARLGFRLLQYVFTRDRRWVSANLAAEVFDSAGDGRGHPALTPHNFTDVAYASTRMLHAWDIPANVAGQPYVDASYTCACPAREVADTGPKTLIAISSEDRSLYRDLYGSERIADGVELAGAVVHVIKPQVSLQSLGVDFADASASSLAVCYQLGVDTGHEFLARHAELLDKRRAAR
jgi:hypothetical protein